MRSLLLSLAAISVIALNAQNTGTNTAKIDYMHFPTLPVNGVNTVGIEIYTGGLPFTKDTLRFYLGNMDILKSGGERLSKLEHQALTDVSVVGGKGDITFTMAFGKADIVSKEMKDAPCAVKRDGCKQYLYMVKYQLPAIVQASNSSGVLDTWELEKNMELQFGNEQIETHTTEGGGSTTSIRVVSFSSPENLDKGFASTGEAWLARKAALVHMREMIEGIYPRMFFEEDKLKFDIAYGKGGATDYSETENAAQTAVEALAGKNYDGLSGPISIWESWLERYDDSDKKAAVNHKVAQGLHENLSIGYTFTGKYDEAREHLDEALVFAQQGMVNTNEVDRLKAFHSFIDDRESAMKHNGAIVPSALVPAPDLKKTLGRRKFNEDIDFIFADNKYSELGGSSGNPSAEPSLEEGLAGLLGAASTTSYKDRAQTGTLVLNALFDGDLKGNPIPESVCEITDLKTLNARNMGLTGIPACIGELTDLGKLMIDGNAITELPDIFGSLSNLNTVDISDNQLTSLPESFYGLKLKKLTVSGNKLGKDVMDRLKSSMPDTKIK